MNGCVIYTILYIFKQKNWQYNHVCALLRVGLISENRNDAESSNGYYNDSTLEPLISEEEMDAISSGNESDYEPMTTDHL